MTARTVLAGAAGAVAALLAIALLLQSEAADLAAADRARAAAVAGATAPEVVAPTSSTDAPYEVWGVDEDGTPVRWDPCSPIRWVFDPSGAPEDAREVISLAMARISDASGLTFEYGGMTSETPSRERSLLSADGQQWAPVLVAWVPGGSTDLPLGDAERGVTVPVAVRDGGPRVFVTGQVLFNSDKQLLPGFEDRHASWGAVVLHELVHLVGLDHVDDPRQLMHPTPGFGPVELGAGDLAGLAAVGAGNGCLEVPPPQELDVTYG